MSSASAAVASVPPRAPTARRRARATVVPLLLVALVALAVLAATIGAAGIPFGRLLAAMGIGDADQAVIARDRLVLWSVRLPRIALAAMIGALLGAGGTVMQGLFRNPLADPGLVGVSSGAALAAAATIVLGDRLAAQTGAVPLPLLPVAAFFGALAIMIALYRIATRSGRTAIAIFLLGGLAIGALANAGIGLLVFAADDRQLRDITFWMLGSLGGATWSKAAAVVPFVVAVLLSIPIIARGLDLLGLGEAEAFYMGIPVQRLKRLCIVLTALAVGAAVSVSGVIGFVGIVVPHLLRLVIGPGHRLLLPASICLGAILLLAADTTARVIVAPAELPIGIVTAAFGAPFFLFLLLRQRALVGL